MSDINTIKTENKEYPRLLAEIGEPPDPLYFKGDIEPKEKCISIVGTRKATRRGRGIAKRMAEKLTNAGLTVVSGLALGIDGEAHRGALMADGRTIAVLAHGLDKVYPSQHKSLADKILKTGGAILSEYKPGTPSYKNQFLERNRLVSGLSIATIVIEAPARSGSLNTAGHAAKQGREVFVVPGPADGQNYIGSHKLIRDGARLVTSAEDILEDLGYKKPDTQQLPGMKDLDKTSKNIIKIIKKESGITAGKISKKLDAAPEKINSKLSMLTLKGIINEENGRFTTNS